MRRQLITALWIMGAFNGTAQHDPYVDSLKEILTHDVHDTTRARIYLDLAEYINDERVWTRYNDKALQLANRGISTSKGKVKLLYQGIKANALGNKGFYYDEKGDKERAIGYYFQALELNDKIGREDSKAAIYGNLGVLYTKQGDHKEAEDYLLKALALKRKYAPEETAVNYLNLGVVYENMGDEQKGLVHHKKAFEAAKKQKDLDNMATALNNIGSLYYKKKAFRSAIPFLAEAIDLSFQNNDESGAAWIMANIGNCYLELKETDSALYYFEQAKVISMRHDLPELAYNVAEKYYHYYYKTGDWKKAHDQLNKVHALEGKLHNIQAQKEGIRQKMAYDHNLEKVTLKMQREEEKKRESQRTVFILIALLLVVVIALVSYWRFRTTRRQKTVIESQKAILETKNEEIVASINYAKYLQQAILPKASFLQTLFDDAFLLYRPKDVVAGDFYWCKVKNELIFIAVADCTGHGVPGSLVSVVCSNALDKAFTESQHPEPAEILNKTRDFVIEQFVTSESEVKDGMDIALCCIDRSNHTLFFSGAHNPCWIKRGEELIEIKGDRQPIGNYDYATPFTQHQFDLRPGDWIYLFSDGFSDQFGGNEGKKIRAAGFKSLLLQQNSLSGDAQLSSLNDYFDRWKGGGEQTDDVCVLGFKV